MAGESDFNFHSLVHVVESVSVMTPASSCGGRMVSDIVESVLYSQLMSSD